MGRREHTTTPDPPSTLTDGLPLPKLIVFDLDYTLWPLWCDTHVSGRITGSTDNGASVSDSHGSTYRFYPEIPSLLRTLHDRRPDIALGIASRTCAPDIAQAMLRGLRAWEMFEFVEIYPGSKVTHFRKIGKKSGVGFGEMLFFDDESRNRNVEELGVVMQLVRDGVDGRVFDQGVQAWRKRNGRVEKEG